MRMQSKVIREWLSEYKSLSEEELNTYASTVRQSEELTTALYKFFENQPALEVLDPVCHQLFEFYRSKEGQLRLFTLEFLPTLIWLYLSSLSSSGKKSCGGLEAFLLAVYNLETVSSDGDAKLKTFRIPTIAGPSVYHEPAHLATLTLTESALSRYNQTDPEPWRGGPYSQFEAINGQNRHGILAYLVQCYNANISELSGTSHQAMCKYCSRIVTTGFTNLYLPGDNEEEYDAGNQVRPDNRGSQYGEIPPRIPVSPCLLIEMLSGLYYILYNGQSSLAIQAVNVIHSRACYELYADVQLVTSAIRNAIKETQSGKFEDGPMGIIISKSCAVTSFSKSAITNASFRAKKLPDDITIPENSSNPQKQLARIEEDDMVEPSAKKLTKPSKQGKKPEKLRLKENKKEFDQLVDHSVINGDTIDSVQISVVRSQSKTLVDNIELKRMANNSDEHLSSKLEDPVPNSPHQVKRRSPNVKTSNSSKDLKSKVGHVRHPSGSSVNSDTHNTPL